MVPAQHYQPLSLFPGRTAFSVCILLICLMTLCACATTVPEIDESLRQKALEGDVQAQYEMGMKYENAARAGWGRSEYWPEAERWFELAASQGYAKAQYELSGYYFSLRQDYSQSFKLVTLAAQQGLANAQYSLGMHYAQAWGTPQDMVLAYKWILLANEGGLKGGSLADVKWLAWKGKMSADQIAEGHQLAAAHTAIYGVSVQIESMQ